MKKIQVDKLDASGGVIKPPPGVDPEIVKPAPVPEPNSTPSHSASWGARRSARSRAEIVICVGPECSWIPPEEVFEGKNGLPG